MRDWGYIGEILYRGLETVWVWPGDVSWYRLFLSGVRAVESFIIYKILFKLFLYLLKLKMPEYLAMSLENKLW